MDWDETYILADLNQAETTILGTWRSAYNEPRNGHIKGKYPDLCRECKTGWEAAHWVLSYERAITIAQKSKVN